MTQAHTSFSLYSPERIHLFDFIIPLWYLNILNWDSNMKLLDLGFREEWSKRSLKIKRFEPLRLISISRLLSLCILCIYIFIWLSTDWWIDGMTSSLICVNAAFWFTSWKHLGSGSNSKQDGRWLIYPYFIVLYLWFANSFSSFLWFIIDILLHCIGYIFSVFFSQNRYQWLFLQNRMTVQLIWVWSIFISWVTTLPLKLCFIFVVGSVETRIIIIICCF